MSTKIFLQLCECCWCLLVVALVFLFSLAVICLCAVVSALLCPRPAVPSPPPSTICPPVGSSCFPSGQLAQSRHSTVQDSKYLLQTPFSWEYRLWDSDLCVHASRLKVYEDKANRGFPPGRNFPLAFSRSQWLMGF